MVGLVAADFTQLFSFRAVLLTAEPVRLRLAMAVPTNPPAMAPTVVAPRTFAVRLRPFLRFELLADVLDPDVLDFIVLLRSVLRAHPFGGRHPYANTFEKTNVTTLKLPTGS